MKKIINDKLLQDKIKEALDILCNTVKTTLGPKGSNVIIDHSSFSPFITNDGVTIANNIESEDQVINTILELAKEASIKTNENVGDGTTTTLVLLQSIYNLGLNLILRGKNPIILKKELSKSLEEIVLQIQGKSHKPTPKELKYIAINASNSQEIGNIVSQAFLKVKNKNAITIKENDSNSTEIVYKKGYTIETNLATKYFLKDKTEITVNNSNILLINTDLYDIEQIANILNYILETKQSLIIIAEDYSNDLVNEILSLSSQENLNIYLLKSPDYGSNKLNILNDLSIISNAKISNGKEINVNDLGRISSVIIDNENTAFIFSINEKIKRNIEILKKELNKKINSNNDFNFISKRLSMFTNGLVEIKVGAQTETERREKKMRFDDALCSISSALNGVMPGSGLILYEISETYKKEKNSNLILKEALKCPFQQIMANAGLESKNILDVIQKYKYKKIYNIKDDTFEDITKTKVLDSTDVVINSLTNALSIASMLLTTTSLIINEYDNDFKKNNNYSEFNM